MEVMKNIDKKQDLLKNTLHSPKKSEDEGNISPEYVQKIKRIMKEERIKIKDIDQFFNED
ncbi:MAG: hypothetical protein B655_2288 [Methanobacterium sp. Maddingley MBC34]|nr:MAG: hypothetical protein B655_2288 [Methanobacterium sp. Maddingley MBC34]